MNVNMVEHQRSIMAVMGIDLWMPKTDVATCAYSNLLYRDQAAPETSTFQRFNDLAPQAETAFDDQTRTEGVELDALTPEKVQLRAKNIRPEATVQVATLGALTAEDSAALKVESFELQALCLDRCVIVVDVTTMSAEQHQLWRNIQSAIQGQYFELKWPFALLNLQDGRGAQSYIQGFLDAICAEKNQICLGELPHFKAHSMVELPSVQEMLQQPLLKAKLWQIMQNKM